jgi:hypothetical protein
LGLVFCTSGAVRDLPKYFPRSERTTHSSHQHSHHTLITSKLALGYVCASFDVTHVHRRSPGPCFGLFCIYKCIHVSHTHTDRHSNTHTHRLTWTLDCVVLMRLLSPTRTRSTAGDVAVALRMPSHADPRCQSIPSCRLYV